MGREQTDGMEKAAIILAAGMGSRLRPVTDEMPKPLVKVKGCPMLETLIDGLQAAQVGHIFVVTGYRREKFSYLEEKYREVKLIFNEEYADKNNISSLKAVGDILGSTDCYICEADLYIRDKSIFHIPVNQSGYFGKMVSGRSEDWVFDVENDRITGIHKGGEDAYNMVGLSYFLKEDATKIRKAIEKTYREEGHGNLFWDEVVDRNLKDVDLRIYPITGTEVCEIDTIQELAELDESYLRYLRF